VGLDLVCKAEKWIVCQSRIGYLMWPRFRSDELSALRADYV
jgi:hypothetical protein